jgi:starch synthase
VSPTYAQEIRTPEQACGLGGVIARRSDALSGILNGVDYALWNPKTDPALAHPYDVDDLSGKAAGKTALQVELGLESRGDIPLFGLVSRLTEQKGLDLVLAGLPALVGNGAQLAILGSGSADLERACASAAEAHPGKVALRLGYDEALAHRMIAGADLIAVPSRFEPCGLTQLYGLRYGTLPLVRRAGGLADTVVDATAANLGSDTASGFVFEDASVTGFLEATQRACAAYRKRTLWLQLMRRAMTRTFSWEEAAASYDDLYQQLQPLNR